jgi:hypothetical protein
MFAPPTVDETATTRALANPVAPDNQTVSAR